VTDLRAVVFDWRGTLVVCTTPIEWVGLALRRAGRDHRSAVAVLSAIETAAGDPDRLGAPGVDCDAGVHRDTYLGVFADAGLDDELAAALYAVESDPAHNPFAVDAVGVLRAIARHGVRIAVLSDIHFDLRPTFEAVGLAGVVDAYVLSFEHGVQKPDPAIFEVALGLLGTRPDETLMVGDRAGPDGGAVAVGMPTLLLPPLTGVGQRRLGLAARTLGVPPVLR
jgi:FMN phosphatase YigB (HAD superfamily)